jgi:hypothetical protein
MLVSAARFNLGLPGIPPAFRHAPLAIEEITCPRELIQRIRGNGHGDEGPKAKARLMSLVPTINEPDVLFSMRDKKVGLTPDELRTVARRMAELELNDVQMARFVAETANESRTEVQAVRRIGELGGYQELAEIVVAGRMSADEDEQIQHAPLAKTALAVLESHINEITVIPVLIVTATDTKDIKVRVVAVEKLADMVEHSNDLDLLVCVVTNRETQDNKQTQALQKLTLLAGDISTDLKIESPLYTVAICLACHSPDDRIRLNAFNALKSDFETVAIQSEYDDTASEAVEKLARIEFEGALKRIEKGARSRKAREKAMEILLAFGISEDDVELGFFAGVSNWN